MESVPRLLGLDSGVKPPEPSGDNDSTSRKWLYLEMKQLFVEMSSRGDIWSDVADVYCDFEHPKAIASLAPWMPLAPGDEPGEAGMLRRWQAYLEREGLALRAGAG